MRFRFNELATAQRSENAGWNAPCVRKNITWLIAKSTKNGRRNNEKSWQESDIDVLIVYGLGTGPRAADQNTLTTRSAVDITTVRCTHR